MRRIYKLFLSTIIAFVLMMIVAPIQAKSHNITFEKTGIISSGPMKATDNKGYGLWWGANFNWEYIKVDGEIAFCIEPEVALDPLNNYTESTFNHAQREMFSKIIYHGYDKNPNAENYVLTQIVLWQYIGTLRDDLVLIDLENVGVSDFETKKNNLMATVNKHDTAASFAGETIHLNVGSSTTLVDKNGVLANSTITSKGGLETQIKDNQLVINAVGGSPLSTTITLKKYGDITSNNYVSPILYSHPTSQNFVSKGNPHPVIYTVNVKINDKGQLEISKLNENKVAVPNTQFIISKNKDMSQPVGTYTTNANGKALISDITYGTYYVQEKFVPSPLLLDDTIHQIEIVAGQATSFSQTNKAALGQIVINKVGKDGHLRNASFNIMNDKQDVIETITTNEKGQAISSQLPLGQYYVTETKAPEGYVLDKTLHEVSLVYKDQLTPLVTQSVELTNEVIKGHIKVVKVDSDTKLPVEGVVFEVFSLESEEFIESITTNEEGIALTSTLEYGQYVIKEKDSPVEYNINEQEHIVSIEKHQEEVAVTIENDPIMIYLQLHKKDTNSQEPLAGVVFEVVNLEGESVLTLTTDDNGIAKSETALPYGVYTLKEIQAAPGYVRGETIEFVIDRETVTIDLENEKVLLLELENEQTTTVIHKKDIYGEVVIGAHLMLIDEMGQKVVEWHSNEEPFVIHGLNANENYVLHEQSAPQGYLLADDMVLNINETLDHQEFTMINYYQPIMDTKATVQLRDASNPQLVEIVDTVKLEKLIPNETYELVGTLIDKESQKPLEVDGEVVVSYLEFNASESDVELDMSYVIHQDDLSEQTLVVFNQLYHQGKLVASHEDINDEDQSVTFKEIVVKKVDSKDGKALSNAEFLLYQDDIIIDQSLTDEKGEIRYILEEGIFSLLESLAPRGYIKSDTIYEFDSTKDLVIEIENDLMKFPPLPSTGQNGEVIILFISSIVLISAGLYLIRRDKH